MKEDISLYLILFERQACMMNVPKEFWISHLLSLLPQEITQLIAREPEQEARDYDHVRSLLLKRFKLTPEKFRQLFVTHQKSSDKTWRDFYQEVQTFVNGWIEGLDLTTFDKLRDLMIADQMKKRASVEFKERHLDEWPSINYPVALAERLEEFEDVRRTLKQKTHTLTPVRRPEVRGSNQVENFRKFDNHNTRRTGNFNPEKRYLGTPPSRDFDRRAPRRYYICHSLEHLSFNCPKAMKEIKREQPNPQVQSCSVTPQKGLHLKSIMLGNEIVSELIDTGSTVSLNREDVSSKIVDHSRLSKINTVLYGLGQTEVITKGSFEHFGTSFFNFTQEGVMFHKHEEKSCLMKISGVHPEDELDFSHILDSQVKNDLNRITASYKPEKTESTGVTRRILLKDDIPVYQPARRLSYAEKKTVNKHIGEWLEQGIARPSSSEYASPIVLVKNKKKGSRVPSW
ncbi:transposon Ty3-I Gag-Pol polyprotein [Trichonephila clavipes]|uniref:Transposon Ty3-I Gag-Pol polyprotein n=1 Tax=Trichonephila clavipes TaxID=2585209 RepID=A0A8X6VGJ2_TRICX|nr:transposon Ty3-I Gag-Pol polyprotein [Trichonephila clavipes]